MSAPQVITPATAEVPDTLARILADKHEEVRARAAAVPAWRRSSAWPSSAPAPRDFTRALCNAVAEGRVGLIAEIKRASPSGGLIRDPFEPAELAAGLLRGRRHLPVRADRRAVFPGRARAPAAPRGPPAPCRCCARTSSSIPGRCSRPARMGADCILLIMAALSDEQAHELEDVARSLDMAVLAEVHDERELDRALGLETRLIGINNRDLRTLQTDLATTEELAPLVPADRIPVAESGIRTPDDVRRMAAAGARCILVGEHLMRQPDVRGAAGAIHAGPDGRPRHSNCGTASRQDRALPVSFAAPRSPDASHAREGRAYRHAVDGMAGLTHFDERGGPRWWTSPPSRRRRGWRWRAAAW